MDYPSNSQQRPKETGPPPQAKKIERVTSGEVVRRKKSIGRRFKDIFVGGDARSVWSYVALDVLIPAAKDTVSDAIKEGLDRMLWGDSRSGGRRGSSRPGGPNGYVSYNRYSSSSIRDRRDDDRRINRRDRATHNFDEIILSTRVEAEEVIDQLFELVSRYDSASVADLYELVGIKSEYTDGKWGWTDIRGAGATRTRGGYLLDLPRPEPLD